MLNTPATDDAASVPEDKKAQALPLIGRARELLTGAEESADFLAQKKETVKKVDDGPKIEEEQGELVQEQTSLTDVLKQLFEILGEKMPEWKGQAQIKFGLVMADDNLPSGIKQRFETAALEGLFNLGEEADGNQQWDMLKNIVNGGGYVAQGEAIPVSELEAKGGMTRVMSMSLLYQFNLSAAEKEKYGTFQDWLQAIANDPANFSPNEHLDMGSNISGRGGIAWWAPRAEQQGNTMAELVEELGLNPASYDGGAVRVTLSAEASNMNGFKKPTALDGIFFAEWEAAPGNVWGVTSGGSLEAIAEAIPLSQATQLEYLSANLPAPIDIKALVKEELITQIGSSIDDSELVNSVIANIYATYQPKGLKSIEIIKSDKIGEFEVLVQASPKTSEHKFVLSDLPLSFPYWENMRTTTLIAEMNGFSRKVSNERGPHAEKELIIDLVNSWEGLIEDNIVYPDRTNNLTINITRSPCDEEGHQCGNLLQEFAQEYNVKLHLRMMSLYGGEQPKGERSFEILKQLRLAGHDLSVLTLEQAISEELYEGADELPEGVRERLQARATQLEQKLAEIEAIKKGG
jgi:hypothetical protein